MMERRSFLRAGVAGAAMAATRGYSAELADQKPKRVGLIGCGWYGKSDLFRLVQVAPVEIVSLCDVDRQMLAGCADMAVARQASKKRPRTYGDYREMLKEKDLDIVLVDTPDHWHAMPMIEAVRAGADVWVQKPVCVDVVEGQAMVAAARKYKRVVQVGTQRRSTPHLIDARNRIREGLLGTVGLVEVYSYGPSWGPALPNAAPPDYLDWEMWTGPAPMRPFNPQIHPRMWRLYMEYGNGIIGDMAIHMFDMSRWFLGLGWPKRISSSGGQRILKGGGPNIADTQTAMFEYDDLTVTWQHRRYGPQADPDYNWGATLYGEKGTLKAGLMGYDFVPNGRGGARIHKDVTYELDKYPEDKTEPDLEYYALPAIRGQMRDLVTCTATRARPVADIEEGYISTACCILGNIAMQLGRTLNWDAERGVVTGDAEANRLLRRPYRAPWVHPEVKTI